MKVADYIINTLGNQGISDIFVVYGAANGDLIDAFTRTDKTRYIAVMHEQAGGFAAEGWAKISGKTGCAIATSGPGGHNFVTPIGNCFYDSVPCLFITGQINSRFFRPTEEIRQIGFQETDIVNIVKPITKYAKTITKIEDVKYELEKALFLAQDGRPGPVLLDIPLDIQKQQIDPEKLIGYKKITHVNEYDISSSTINSLITDITNSRRPVILVGGGLGSTAARNYIIQLGQYLKIPIFPTWNALDIICDDYEYYGGRVGTYGGKGRNFAIQNSDLLICIGTRLSGRITGGNINSFAREAKKYLIDIDKAALQPKLQQVPFDVNIYCDAKIFMEVLFKEKIDKIDRKEWCKQVFYWRDKYDPVTSEMYGSGPYVHPYVFCRELSKCMGRNDILVGDCGGNIVCLNHAFETKTGQRYFTNNGNSPMGFSMAGAIGAQIAEPNKKVVCVIGDGGMNMNIQELQTIVNYNLPLKIVILNNHIYGITKAFQETNFEGRCEACGPKGYSPPNFIKIANAYGIPAVTINSNSELDNIDKYLDVFGPIIIDVNCHEYHTYEPRIFGWKTPIEDMYPYLPEKEFLENMMIKPLDSYKNREYPNVH